jgi:L-iditol 2-dehydrogenase
MHLQLAKLNGAKQILAIDLNPKRLTIARELGATAIINPSETNDIEEVKKLTNGRGAEVVIEAAGSPVTWENAIKMTRPAGTTVLFSGLKPGTTITVDSRQLHYEDLTIKGIFHHTPFYVEKAFNFIVSGQLKTEPLITHEMPLSDLEKALQAMIDGDALKVAILP